MAIERLRFALAGLMIFPALVLAQAPQTPPQAPEKFDTPEAAAQALIDASSKDDTARLAAIFGPRGKSILTSGDPAQDKTERAEFSRIAHDKHELQRDSMNSNRMILSIGSEDWPFPVPIVKTGGKWSFDTSMGALAMRARRIGANELDVIEICSAYVAAQQEYAHTDPAKRGMLQYARRIKSSAGQRDGLYSEGEPQPLVPKDFGAAAADGPASAAAPLKPYHGYYFKVLTAQGPNAPGGPHNYLVKGSLIGGFGLVAWPAQYGTSGIRTFIVNQDGIVYERDLGPPANNSASPVTRYDPGKPWKPVN